MGFHSFKDIRMGIAVKMAGAVGIAIMLLMAVNCIIFLNLESKLVSHIFSEYETKIEKAIENQGEKQAQSIKGNVSTHARVLANSAATFLYDLDKHALKRTLEAYIKLPELKAVKVLDDEGNPFFAIWKNPKIQSKRELPKNISLDKAYSGKADAVIKKEKVGSVEVFFTDALIKAQMKSSKDKIKADVVKFRKTVYDKLNQSIWIQIGVILCVVIILVTIIVFTLNFLAVKPVRFLAEGARRFSIGDIALEGMKVDEISKINSRHDELGDIGNAFSQLIEYMQTKANGAGQIAKGNLDIEMKMSSKSDQLGKALAMMVESLNRIVADLNTAAEQMDNGSNQVADSSNSLSQGATTQASSVEEITSTMTELSSQTNTNAENANQANQLSSKARDAAGSGVMKMEELVEAMKAINISSGEIGKIIKTIDDIAFQTNLLALNAAVEAARAGKHGKGFAVVAQEVRNLAARSAKAAQETSELIEGAVKEANNGNKLVGETALALEAINDAVAKVTDLVGEIAMASDEQAKGITQINQGLVQIESVTQQNTANAEETSSAAEELSSQAAHVRKLLSSFKLRRSGDSPGQPRLPAAVKEPGSQKDAGSWGGEPQSPAKDQIIRPDQIISLE